MFALPQASAQDKDVGEGSCDDHPIHLLGEKALDFEAFLSLLYPL